MLPDLVPLVLYGLAVTRLVGLLCLDTITERPRDAAVVWLEARRQPGPLVAELLLCPWCVAVWMSAAAAPLVWWFGGSPWLLVPALALAFAQVAGMLSRVGR